MAFRLTNVNGDMRLIDPSTGKNVENVRSVEVSGIDPEHGYIPQLKVILNNPDIEIDVSIDKTMFEEICPLCGKELDKND